ncbi:unnamed protein product [Aureobasidium uvarum]|uniref:Uncharacterized protein n=1 Tax=Aureobasidium uvarum TaxID=2773716 RepID=A0A9N8K8L7_9PEZI|nr:unnamed protein product [Aureobasidium uvarum]
MFFKHTVAALSAVATAFAAPHMKRANGFNWGNEVMRGVNLGGWLVLEP